ncbi:MAG: hypothetical protein ACTSQY_08890 [Candidatus Odinarchaeia archaeon]
MINEKIKNEIVKANTKTYYKGPTLLFGNIETNKIIGEKKKKTEKLIVKIEQMRKTLEINHIYDIIVDDKDKLEKSIEFITNINKKMFAVDSASQKTLTYAIEISAEQGVIDRLIINSITPNITQEFLEIIKEFKVKNAIVLPYNPKDITTEGRLNALKEILTKIKDTPIKTILVDSIVTDIDSINETIKTINKVKSEYNLPVGCAPTNASWVMKKKKPEFLRKNFQSYDTSLHVIMRCFGADFLIYGSIRSYSRIFKSISLCDNILCNLKRIEPVNEK